jgi:hypothetical protein
MPCLPGRARVGPDCALSETRINATFLPNQSTGLRHFGRQSGKTRAYKYILASEQKGGFNGKWLGQQVLLGCRWIATWASQLL